MKSGLIRHLVYSIDAGNGVIYGPRGFPVGSRNNGGYIRVDGASHGLGSLNGHRLIWEAVNGPIPAGFEINHKNGIKTDNRITNLELVTHQENMRHAYRIGLKSNRGDKHPSRKLCSTQVREIRQLLKVGSDCRDLARQFGVTRETIYHIRARKTWSHLGD